MNYALSKRHSALWPRFNPVSLHQPFSLAACCDVDWAADPDDRRSTSDSAVYLGANLISWWSRKQTVVARSSTKAEYRSLAQTTTEILWVQTLLTELAVPFSVPVIFCDTQDDSPVLHACTKNMEIDLFFVREKVISKSLRVTHIPGCDQKADEFTKPLSSAKFLEFREKLNVTALHTAQSH